MRKDGQVDEEGYTTERKLFVTDGESYTIEIKIGDKFRIYEFENLKSYSKFYDNVSELKHYLHIVQSFEEYLYRN